MSELPSSATPSDAAPAPSAPSEAGTAAPVPAADPIVAAAPQEAPEAAGPAEAPLPVESAAPPAAEAPSADSALPTAEAMAAEPPVVPPAAAAVDGEVAAAPAASRGERRRNKEGKPGGQPRPAGGHAQGETRAPGRQDVPDCGPQLRQQFPALFGGPAKPIKLRIQSDIQERAPGIYTKQQLSAFLRRYTGSHAYLNALLKATHRFDLDGQPVEELSAEHRQVAIDELARRRTNAQARQEQENQQRAQRATLLREFSETTLPPAEFAHSKGIELDALLPTLERARQEAHAPVPARDAHRRPPRGPRHGDAGAGGGAEREPRGHRNDGQRRRGHGAHDETPGRPKSPHSPSGGGAGLRHAPGGAHGGPAADRGAPGASANPGPAPQAHSGAPEGQRPAGPGRPDGPRPPRPSRPQGEAARGNDRRGPPREGDRPPRPEGERRPHADSARGDGPRRDRPRDDRPREARPAGDRGPRPGPRQDAPGPTAMANALAAVRDALKKPGK